MRRTALLNAARRMSDDGWWWAASPKMIQWAICKELIKGMLPSVFSKRPSAKAA